MEIAVTGTTAFVYYIVDVYGINEEGKGETASTSAFQLNYNAATGGEVPEGVVVDNYNGTGQKWKVHTFTPTTLEKTITVIDAPGSYPFRVLAIAGGGGNGRDAGDSAANGPGNAGEIFQNDDMNLSAIEYSFTVGTGGAERSNSSSSGAGSPGNPTTAFGNTLNGGSSTGPGVTYRYGKGVEGVGDNNKEQEYGKGHDSNITGEDAFYGYGGKGYPNIANWTPQWQPMGPGAGGTVWEDIDGSPGAASRSGQDGLVIVAYQIGTSTSRQIQQAEAEEAARQAGVEQGIQQGYSQAQQDLQEELTSLRTQISAVGTTDV